MTQSWPYWEKPGESFETLPTFNEPNQSQLLRTFLFVALALIGYQLFGVKTDSFLNNIGAALITASALYPGYLWCSGKAKGMPIYPFFALTYTWTHALPLITDHPTVITYSPESRFFASLTVSGFLLLGTWSWFRLVKDTVPTPDHYLMLDEKKGDNFFLAILAGGVLFYISSIGGWGIFDGTLFSTIRNAVLGLSALASFILAYRLGQNELSRWQAGLFLSLLLLYMMTSAVGLLLIGAASTFLVATLAFIIGRRRVPIVAILIVVTCLFLLHYGKSEMRSRYWAIGIPTMQAWDYPAWYSEWANYGLESFGRSEEESEPGDEEVSLLERSSVIHMLLLAQSKSPETIPYMMGKTYAILPQVIVPRALNPDKIRTTEGTHLISIHYGLQTYEQTLNTSISWGLLAESYANFGLIGVGGLALIFGWAYGKVGQWTINAPILSAQSLYSILFVTFALQTEWTAGVYVAALFQSSVVVGVIVFCFMRKQRVFPNLENSYKSIKIKAKQI